jgi:hypothetical protein
VRFSTSPCDISLCSRSAFNLSPISIVVLLIFEPDF